MPATFYSNRGQKLTSLSLLLSSTTAPQTTGSQVILDIAHKCGVTGSTKQNIVVNYKITVSSVFAPIFMIINWTIQLGIRILVVTISPVISEPI